MSNEPPRAHYDNDLEFDDDLALLDGVPFTGIVYADYPDGGREVEFNYVAGLPSGIQRSWHPNGQLESEAKAIRGRGSAWSREWHPNGVMRLEQINDDLRPIRIREWSEDGTLLCDMDPDHPDLAG